MTQKSKENWMDHPDLRAALQELRTEHERPSPLSATDKETIRQQLAVGLLAAPAMGAPEPASVMPNSASGVGQAGSSLLTGKTAIAVLVGLAGLVPVWLSVGGSSAQAPRGEVIAPSATQIAPAPDLPVVIPPKASERAESKPTVVLPQPKPTSKTPRARAAPQSVEAHESAGASLREEVELLRLARASLAESPALAREALKQYRERFPYGVMRVEYEKLLRRSEVPRDSATTEAK
jgi:hypothetical protein